MYTFCSFYQEIKKLLKIGYLIDLMDNVPICLASSNWDTMKSLSDFEKAILASNNKLLD